MSTTRRTVLAALAAGLGLAALGSPPSAAASGPRRYRLQISGMT